MTATKEENVMDIKLTDIPPGDVYQAIHNIMHFAKEYPDRVGVRALCAYQARPSGITMAVYRTKGGCLVARGHPA